MAIVDEKYILLLENLRCKLIQILKNKGVVVNNNHTLNELIPMINKLIETDGINKYLSGSINEFINDNITTLRIYSFYADATLDKVKCDNLENLTSSFINCTSLKHIWFPKLTTILSIQSFQNSILENAILPSLNRAGSDYFLVCNSKTLKRVITPLLERSISGACFNSNNCIEIVDGKYSAIYTNKLPQCKIFISRQTKIPTLSDISFIPNIEEIYIAESLVEQLKAATNWSVYADKIKPIEGSKYENLEWYKKEDWYAEEMSVWK